MVAIVAVHAVSRSDARSSWSLREPGQSARPAGDDESDDRRENEQQEERRERGDDHRRPRRATRRSAGAAVALFRER